MPVSTVMLMFILGIAFILLLTLLVPIAFLPWRRSPRDSSELHISNAKKWNGSFF